MSKRELKKYLSELDKGQIEEQFLQLYEKFAEVKTYYDFIFNPKEEKLMGEARQKIANEYFPAKGKRAKLRRSTAQRYIKHFMVLGVEPHLIADVMFFNIETAQQYTAKREMRYSSFYKSMLNSYEQAVKFIIEKGIVPEFTGRVRSILNETMRQRWDNRFEMERTAAMVLEE